MFEAILGNESVKAYLRRAVTEKKLPHALLFAGLDGIGKSLFASDLAAGLIGDKTRVEAEIHPDFHVMRPEGKTGLHSLETIRSLIDDVHKAPFEAPFKVFLIRDAHRMQPAAANALLKTLEEPCSGTVLILLTSALQEILPTIVSRCSTLRFQPLSEEAITSLLRAKGLPEGLAKRAHGSAGRAFGLVDREEIENILFRCLAQRQSYPDLVAILEKIEQSIENEDSVKYSEAVEHIFSCVLMWQRDRVARSFCVPLFFPDSAPTGDFLVSESFLSEAEKIVDEARLAFSRNIRLSTCLEKIFMAILLVFTVFILPMTQLDGQHVAPLPWSALVEVQAALGGQVLSLLHRRPTIGCECSRDQRAWLDPIGNWLREGNLNGQTGFQAATKGFAAGYDLPLGEYWWIGSGLIWNHTHLNWHKGLGVGSINRYLAALYSDFQWEGVYCALSLYTGVDTNDVSRHIQTTANTSSLHSHFNAIDLGAQLSTAYFFELPLCYLYPYANFDYLFFREQKFSETGTSSFQLQIEAYKSHTIRTEAGIGFQVRDTNLSETISVVPTVAVGWAMECPVGRSSLVASLLDEPLTFEASGWNHTWQLLSLDFGLAIYIYHFVLSGEYVSETSPSTPKDFWAQRANISLEYFW